MMKWHAIVPSIYHVYRDYVYVCDNGHIPHVLSLTVSSDTLPFDAIQKNNAGEYTCTATNSVQNQVKHASSSVTIDVICKYNWNCFGNFPWNQTSDVHRVSTLISDNVTLKLHNVTLTSKKPCQYNNKFEVTTFHKML